MYYLIKETLEKTTYEECLKHEYPYVAIVTAEEFSKQSELFDMGIDMDIDYENPGVSKILVNYDSLTGCFSVPDRDNIFGEKAEFSFVLDEKGVVFLNDDGHAAQIVEKIRVTRKWRNPSLERFIFDFMERIVEKDLALYEQYDKRLDELEDLVLANEAGDDFIETLLDMRGELLELHTHYEQLMDISQELEENENNFFDARNIRYFSMFTNRISRLNDVLSSLRERVIQIRDLYNTQLEVRQNKISTVLTVVATIFMPLTLIVGWYGMNFKYMPELEMRWSYPALLGICLLIILGGIIFFKKKKLL